MSKVLLTFYTVRFINGRYLKAKGNSYSGPITVDSLEKARIYSKIGPAKAIVTYCAKRSPNEVVPDIIELHVTQEVVLNQEEYVKKAAKAKENAKQLEKIRKAKYELDSLAREYKRAKDNYDSLAKDF